MIEPPKENKRRAAVRVIIEALAQGHPVTAGLAHIYRFTHPSEMERAVEAWRGEITGVANDHEGRIRVIEDHLRPRLTIGEAALAVALWLVKETEPWPNKIVMFDQLAAVFPDIPPPELEEACAELEHLGFVRTSAVMGQLIHTVQARAALFWAFDPVVVGTDPTADARELAARLLDGPSLGVVANLEAEVGWPRRRLNPAVARLMPYFGKGQISQEINGAYPTTRLFLIPEIRFKLRRFAEGREA